MGRAKLSMEIIRNRKDRFQTFQKRNKSLQKKAEELSKLCDVKVGVIISAPTLDNNQTRVEIWPQDSLEIQKLINMYKTQSNEDRSKRTFQLSHFFEDKKKKVEDALFKLRRTNGEAKYSTWNDLYNNLSEQELRELHCVLESKLEDVKHQLALRNDSSHAQPFHNDSYLMHMQGTFRRSSSMQFNDVHQLPVSSHDVSVPFHYTVDQSRFQLDTNLMPMTMLLNDNDYYSQLGGEPSSSNLLMCNPLNETPSYDPVSCYDPISCYDPVSEMMKSTVTTNSQPPLFFCSPTMRSTPPHMQYPTMNGGSAQMHASHIDNFYAFGDSRMKNEK